MKFSHFLNSNLLLLLIFSSMVMYSIFSFDLQWNEPTETHIDLSEHFSDTNSILYIYPVKIIQSSSSLYYGIWSTALWGEPNLFFFGSTHNYNSWSNLINLNDLFSTIEGNLKDCDFVILENNSFALLGIKTISESVNGTWITHQNLVMSLSNDLGTNWSPILLINNTELPSAFFGVYLDSGIKFWTIVNYANQYVEYVNLWAYNESTNLISQTHVYHPESLIHIYREPAVSNEGLFFLEHENNNNYLLHFNGTSWKRTPILLTDKRPELFITSKSQVYLVYSFYNVYYIGKLSIDNLKNEITIIESTKIASNWFAVWPILNSTISTFFIFDHHDGIASVTKSFNWSVIIFTTVFSLFFIILWVIPFHKSFILWRK